MADKYQARLQASIYSIIPCTININHSCSQSRSFTFWGIVNTVSIE